MNYIDLRSDTVTRPTEGMRKAMYAAEVGDDVFKEDPTVNAFQRRVADLFGMEVGVFVPSGTMGNQLALNVQSRPGDEVIADKTAHIYNYETAAAPFLSGLQFHLIEGKQGIMGLEQIRAGFRGDNDWDPHTQIIALENTTNKGGGAYYTREQLQAIRALATEKGVALHIDGARIWNAAHASGIPLSFFGEIADTISVCFSKALGAPVGSMLLCGRDLARNAIRKRKMWGGGMRQVGILAAAADYALTHHYPLLPEDHRRARELAHFLDEFPMFSVNAASVHTNIVLFDVDGITVAEALSRMEAHGVGMSAFGPKTIRAVLHFQIDDAAMFALKNILKREFQ